MRPSFRNVGNQITQSRGLRREQYLHDVRGFGRFCFLNLCAHKNTVHLNGRWLQTFVSKFRPLSNGTVVTIRWQCDVDTMHTSHTGCDALRWYALQRHELSWIRRWRVMWWVRKVLGSAVLRQKWWTRLYYCSQGTVPGQRKIQIILYRTIQENFKLYPCFRITRTFPIVRNEHWYGTSRCDVNTR